MKTKHAILLLCTFTILIRLPFLFNWHEVWWDAGVYIGMGKYLFSIGKIGLWEHIRPPLLPLILGTLWFLGIDPLFFGTLLEVILMTGIVTLTYLLCEHWFNKRTALLSALIIAVSPIFYYLSFHQYTEIPSTFFILLALYLHLKNKHFFAGLSLALAFLSKFTSGIYLPILLALLLFNKKYRELGFTLAGFSIPNTPYLIYSWIAHGTPWATLVAAQNAITQVLGCNVIRAQPWWQYGYWLIFSETKFYLVGIAGAYALWKTWKKNHTLYLTCLTLPLLYLITLHCRDYRYITLILPFAAMLPAYGLTYFTKKLKPVAYALLVIGLTLWMLHTSILFYHGNEPQKPDINRENYYRYLNQKNFTGELWTANPILAAYNDHKYEKIYYPIYDKGLSKTFQDYLHTNASISAVILDNCGGGIICAPNDDICEQKTQELITLLDSRMNRSFEREQGNCWFRIWTTS